MGHRAWLTPVNNEKDFKHVIDTAENADFCYGVSYVVQITKTGAPFKTGTIVIAWSGDSSNTVNALKSKQLILSTYLLDGFLFDFPDWHMGKGPEAYGNFLESGEEPDWSLIKE
jgi:hypothetical protein